VFSGFHTNFADYAGHYGLGWLAPVVQRYLRQLHNRTRGTLVASPELRRRLLGVGFNGVLGRGVDGELFDPARRSARLRATWGAGSKDLVALYVGRLAPEKNVPLAVEAYRAMQRVQSGARCVIVGDGPLRGELEKAHSDLVFCGMRTDTDLAAHYASADVFLFPSETETFGNVTLEAMASGLVVVAYDYAAARIHVAHGESGTLVPRGDAHAFVEGAAALARGPECLSAMRRCARAHAASVDWPSVVAVFEALLTGPRGERIRKSRRAGAMGEPQPEARRADTESRGERERASRVKIGRPI
jgi:glycosyltransferase involved in cell wall biosynthesis